ncbi:molybdopterin-dependent oxidoreductase, partial [bacterium]|nr:molybdopterin-dependent oxidoreductase [candidate division CSSED10-310 bacterium]
QNITVEKDERLIDLLRDRLGLTGTKEGCASGSCGCCTVLVNGRALKSCRILAHELDNAEILTIEGLARDGILHPLQQAFLECGAVQCGFCTPGMILRAYAYLVQKDNEFCKDIKTFMRSNLCRCTGYLQIEEAILCASEMLQKNRPAITQLSGIGESPIRTDGFEKVTGEAKFAADYFLPQMCHAVPVLSNCPHGKLTSINTAKAMAVTGVIRILTSTDVPGANALGRWRSDRPVFVEKEVRYVGDIIALVIAESPKSASKAAKLMEYFIEPVSGVFSPKDALLPDSPLIHETGNLVSSIEIRKTSEILTSQNVQNVSSSMRTVFVEHAVMEPEASVAYFDDDNVLTVIGPSQNVFFDRLEILRILGISPRDSHKVRIIQAHTGGAFGKREDMVAQPLAALACWHVKRPVKIVLSRQDSFLSTTKRHPMEIHIKSTITSDYKPVSMNIDILADTGAYASWAPNIIRKAAVHSSGPYEIPNVSVLARSVHTNSAFSGAMRGFGAVQSILAVETHMDSIARTFGLDPLDLRLKWALKKGSRTCTGQIIRSQGLQAVLEEAASLFHWSGQAKGNLDDGESKKGFGIAGAFYGIGYGNAINDRGRVEVIVKANGEIQVITSAVDYGQGSSTIFKQIACETLGIPWENTTIITGDTQLTCDSGSTVASRQTFVTGNAVKKACEILKSRLIEAVSLHMNCLKSEIVVSAKGWKRGKNQYLKWTDIVNVAIESNCDLYSKSSYINTTEKMDEQTGQGAIYKTYAFSAACAEVAVNPLSGRIEVRRMVSVHDSGTIINPVLAKGQVIGGVVMAAGMVLSENYVVNKGIPASMDFDTYVIPKFGDIPEVDVKFIESVDSYGPYGAKGLGEPAMLAAAPAIVNAITDAIGMTVHAIPVTEKRIRSFFNSNKH